MSCRWTVARFLKGWEPNPIANPLKFPPVPVPPEFELFNYLRPSGLDLYRQPNGINLYKRKV